MRPRSLIATMSAAALLAGLTVALAATPAAAANTNVCNTYCDGRDPALSAGDRVAATATVWSRNITLNFDDADDMAWANIANGSATDEVWIDRSFDGGQTFAAGNQLGDTTIPSGDTSWRTLMYNVDNPSADGVGTVRACGKAGNRTDVACTPWMRTTTHASTPSAASITALMQYFNPSTGSWDGTAGWQDANALTDLLDYIQLTGDSTYAYAIPLIYKDQGGANFTDAYIDDTGWWGLAWLRAYQYTGNTSYLQTAEFDENFMSQYWDSTCGGGVWWSTAKNAKNAIANELYLELNAALHNAVAGDTLYLSRAEQEWTWFSGTGMINSQSLVNDGLNLSTCKNNGAATFTYNQGVILAGLSQLNLASPNSSLLSTANAIATAATFHLVTNGVLVDPCEPNGCANDGYSFKGIFVRDLAEFARTTNTPAYNGFLNAQASSILANDTNGDGQSGLQWAGPLDNVVYPDQQSASDAFNGTLDLPTASSGSLTVTASQYSAQNSTGTEATGDTGGGSDVGWINSSSWLEYDNVNFGSGYPGIQARIASGVSGTGIGTIQFRLDSLTATPFATVPVNSTGGWQTWVTSPAVADSPAPTGTHTLYVTFTTTTGGNFVNVNWFQFGSTVVNPPPPPPPPPTPPTGAITGYGGLCVDVAGSNTADGTKVDVYTCNGTGAQQWTAESNQTLQALGKCLDVTGAGTADGTLVELYTCNGTGAQTWQHQTNGSLLNPNSGKCLDDPGFSTTAGTQLDIWACNGGANQNWSAP